MTFDFGWPLKVKSRSQNFSCDWTAELSGREASCLFSYGYYEMSAWCMYTQAFWFVAEPENEILTTWNFFESVTQWNQYIMYTMILVECLNDAFQCEIMSDKFVQIWQCISQPCLKAVSYHPCIFMASDRFFFECVFIVLRMQIC
jgi:hypothetical protein